MASDPRPDDDNAPTMLGIGGRGSEDLTLVDFGASEPTSISPVSFDRPPTHEEIAAEAYAIFEARGGTDGSHESDWLEAERRLKTKRGQAG